MMTKSIASAIFIVSLLLVPSSIIGQSGQVSDQWRSLGSHVNTEIAVKASGQKTIFGVLVSHNDAELKIKAADGQSVFDITLRRTEVRKIWSATLNQSSRNTLKGIAIGAGIGAGVGVGLVVASRNDPENDDGLAGAAIPLLAAPGALIGGVVGFFARTKHKKGRLIYKA